MEAFAGVNEIGAREDDAIVFELCAESLQACRIARAAGADRIEFCADLAVDGLTPSPALTRAAIEESQLPVYMLLRPRAGDFVYTAAEFARMQDDLRRAKALGVSGFALGVLLPDGRVDQERTRQLVELAAPLDVTFHRAFDATPDLATALEDVIATGCRRVLTSGGATDVITGAAMLAALVRQAGARIVIAAGGGIRTDNARTLAEQTGAHHFHGSLRFASSPTRPRITPGPHANGSSYTATQQAVAAPPPAAAASGEIDPQAISQVIQELRRGAAEHHAPSRER